MDLAKGKVLYDIATKHANNRDNEKAIIYFTKAMRCTPKTNVFYLEIIMGRAHCFIYVDNYDKAKTDLDVALVLYGTFPDFEKAHILLALMGTYFYNSRNYDQALEWFQKTDQHCVKIGDLHRRIEVNVGMIEVYLQKKVFITFFAGYLIRQLINNF